jgi:hypothetical protein
MTGVHDKLMWDGWIQGKLNNDWNSCKIPQRPCSPLMYRVLVDDWRQFELLTQR